MNERKVFTLAAIILTCAAWSRVFAQNNIDLSTRCAGVPPSHVTVNSVAQWMQNPVEQKLEIAITNLYADTNEYMEIDIAGKQLTFYGASVDAAGDYIPTNYPPIEVDLAVRREYPITIVCPDGNDNAELSGTAGIVFYVEPPQQLNVNKYMPAPNYSVLFNGIVQQTNSPFQLQRSSGSDLSLTNGVLMLQEDKFGHFGLGDGCDDATKAPGQASWLQIGPGCNQDTNRISIKWSVSLGRTFDDEAAGLLAISEPGISRSIYTPFALYYNASMTNLYSEMPLGTPGVAFVATNLYSSVVLITTNVPDVQASSSGENYTNYDVLIRQVKAYQSFVDVTTPSTNEMVLNVYHAGDVATNQDQNGLYTNFLNPEFVSYAIENPNPANTNDLYIIETRGGISSTQTLVKSYNSTGTLWTLTQGSGAATRVETRQVSVSPRYLQPTALRLTPCNTKTAPRQTINARRHTNHTPGDGN